MTVRLPGFTALIAAFFIFSFSQKLGAQEHLPGYTDALSLYSSGKFNDSLEKVREIFATHSGAYELRLLAAANYNKLGDFNSAVAHLNYSIQDYPARYEPRLILAGILRKQKLYSRAIYMARSALPLTNDKLPLQMEVARSFYLARNYPAAQKTVDDIIALDVNYFEAIYMDGLLYLRKNKFESAEFRLKQALQYAPINSPVRDDLMNNLGYSIEQNAIVALKNGDAQKATAMFQEAVKYYKDALRLNKNNARASFNLKRVEKRI